MSVEDAELYSMSVKQLEELRAQVEVAIRAAIRAKQAGKQQPALQTQAAAAAPANKVIDLERERDAWLRARSR